MTEAEARRLLLVRAVEREDSDFAIFTSEDRQQATAAGLAGSGLNGSHNRKDSDERFLVARSDFAFARLATRAPAIAQIEGRMRWPAWIGWALPCLALVLGVATNEIGDADRLNIIAFPLLSMIAWNVAVYLALLVEQLRRLRRGGARGDRQGALATLMRWFVGRAQPARGDRGVTGRAIRQFVADWLVASSALNQSRFRRTLHLSAAALAAGVLVGMYGRALGVEYRAGWESTFIDAETLSRFVHLILGPASALTGVPLPSVDQLEAIRWDRPRNGENAGPWIHLFATTAALFIIAPRLLLAACEASQAWWLTRRLPVPGAEDFYVRRLLRDAKDVGSLVRVVPYSFHLPSSTEQRLQTLLKALLGDRAQVAMDAPVAFGADEAWLSALSLDPETDHLLVLFNLSATPEAETHGDFIAQLKARIVTERAGFPLTVIVDESAYRQRLNGQIGSDQRLQARRAAWRAVISRVGVVELSADLSRDDESALLAKLESVMMKDPTLTNRGRAQ